MANLGQKAGIYHIRFRYQSKEYKKSLKTSDQTHAQTVRLSVELTISRLMTGLLSIPEGVDIGAFIISGGQVTVAPRTQTPSPSTASLIREFLQRQTLLVSQSYCSSQGTHLKHLLKYLGEKVDLPCDHVTHRDLDGYLQKRLTHRDPHTVCKERITILQFYKWVVGEKYLISSPAAALAPIKFGRDLDPFRTMYEIDRIIERGFISDNEILDLWGCLYLTPQEIAELLGVAGKRSILDYSSLLHAIPAYTGMRRGEILRLRWSDVDLEDNLIYARSHKQSRSKKETVRRIDLHPELQQMLVKWRTKRPKGQFVISDKATLDPIQKDKANRAFWQPMRGTEWCLDSKRNWFKVGFHTYRHSFASNLAAAGVDQRIIDEWMGHQTEAMRKRYRHLFPKDRRSAIESLSFCKVAYSEMGESEAEGKETTQ